MIALQQAFDEYERTKLSRETKRGMRQTALQGFRCGGRAPYGYRLERTAAPRRRPRQGRRGQDPARPRPRPGAGDRRDLPPLGRQGLGLQGDRRPPQPPRRPALPQPRRPQAQRPRRLGQEHHPRDAQATPPTPAAWSGTASTSPPSARPAAPPGCAPRRSGSISEVEHLPLVSDELFAAAQARFRQRGRAATGGATAKRLPVHRHGPLRLRPPAARHVRAQPQAAHLHDLRLRPHLRQGRRRPDRRPRPVALPPRRRPAAARRDVLRRADLRTDAPREARPPAARPPEDDAKQRRHASSGCASRSPTSTTASASRSRRSSDGVEPDLVAERIAKLRESQGERRNRAPRPRTPRRPIRAPPRTCQRCSRASPTSARPCATRPAEIKRQVFDAFGLQIPTTSSTGGSRSRPPSPRRSPTPSRTRKTSRRRSRASLKGT